jgi:hypothetical protein
MGVYGGMVVKLQLLTSAMAEGGQLQVPAFHHKTFRVPSDVRPYFWNSVLIIRCHSSVVKTDLRNWKVN